MKQGVGLAFRKALRLLGRDVAWQRVSRAFTMEGGLMRTRDRGIQVGSVIDVGASDGRWTRLCMKHFPNAAYLLVEAQPIHEPALRTLASRRPTVEYIIAAAGDRFGEIYFDGSEPFGGLASEEPFMRNNLRVPVTTLDYEVERRGLPPPYLIKLDPWL
jgi:FkbM family methyltransferase